MIRLIPLEENHVKHIMTWVNDPDVIQYFASMQKKFTHKEALEFVKKMIKSKTDKIYSVFDENDYIGQVAINQIHWPSEEGRLFVVITKKKQRKGYAKKIIKEIQRLAFNVLGLYRLYLIVRVDNEKGLYIYNASGFRQEGHLYGKYKVNDKRIDMIQMVILKPWYEKFVKKLDFGKFTEFEPAAEATEMLYM